MMQLSMSLASAMPRIEGASSEWLAEFGLDPAACKGRTINIVTGPESNVKQLASLFETVQHGKQAQATTILYDRAGTGALFRVHAQPSCSAETCEVAMRRCDTVSYDAAVKEDGTAKVLLEARKPFRVHRASSAFETAYGFEAARLANRTLSIITGPNTDAKALQQMLDGALEGSTRKACLQTYTRCGAELGKGMSCAQATPVVQGGEIKYLLVTIGPSATSCSSARGSDVEFPTAEDFNEPPSLLSSAPMAALPCPGPVKETTTRRRRHRVAPREQKHADAPLCSHGREPTASQCRLLVSVFVLCSLVVLPWDRNCVALLLCCFMLWCALDVLAAHSARQTRMRARGAAKKGRHAVSSQYARDWALLHDHVSLWGEADFSPYTY